MKLQKVAGLLGMAAILASPAGWAATAWLFAGSGANCIDPTVDCSNAALSKTFDSLPDASAAITRVWITASGSDATLKAAEHSLYPAGSGASSDPGHATDNSGPEDAILFDTRVGNDVELEGVKLGWATEGSGSYAGYADLTRLAYTGTVSADLGVDGMLFDYAGTHNLVVEGWLNIDDYANVTDNRGAYTRIDAGGRSSRQRLSVP